jgi:hypothetical protein
MATAKGIPVPSEHELTAWHEAGHAIVGAHFGLRVRSIHIDPPRGLTSFHQDVCFARLAPRRHCLVSMAGEVAEAKISGRALIPDLGKIRAAVRGLRQNESLPRGDIGNITRALAAENCDDLLAQELLRRVRAIRRLLDDDVVWAKVAAVAAALVARGQLNGSEVEDLIGAADQQALRRLYSDC